MNEQTLSVLFSDIKGYTRITKQVAHGVLQDLLDNYLSRMAQIIEANHGTIDKVMGDGILALFGTSGPDHAYNASLAALQMQQATEQLQEEWHAAGPNVDLQIRIGIATDTVLTGPLNIGGDHGPTAVGDGVNLASRLQDKAAPGSTLISQTTRQLLSNTIPCTPIVGLELKGYADAYTAYRITGWPARLATQPKHAQQAVEASDGRDKRRSARRGLKLEIKYATGQDVRTETTVNVSETGAFIQTEAPNSIGTLMKVYGRLPTGRGILPLTIDARVVRHNSTDELPGMGIEFLSVQSEKLETIEYFIHNMFGLSKAESAKVRRDGAQFVLDIDHATNTGTVDGMSVALPPSVTSDGETNYLARRLRHEFERTKRYNHELSCIGVRIQNLRQLGTPTAVAQLLEQAADVIRLSVRTTDEVFYIGEATFVILAPETMANRISTLCQRIVASLHRVLHGGDHGPEHEELSLAAGSFSFDGHNAQSPDEVLDRTLSSC